MLTPFSVKKSPTLSGNPAPPKNTPFVPFARSSIDSGPELAISTSRDGMVRSSGSVEMPNFSRSSVWRNKLSVFRSLKSDSPVHGLIELEIREGDPQVGPKRSVMNAPYVYAAQQKDKSVGYQSGRMPSKGLRDTSGSAGRERDSPNLCFRACSNRTMHQKPYESDRIDISRRPSARGKGLSTHKRNDLWVTSRARSMKIDSRVISFLLAL
jgi:hypothetical protein